MSKDETLEYIRDLILYSDDVVMLSEIVIERIEELIRAERADAMLCVE